ncbi:MAG: CAP domain-containing protein [Lachnospiraceae bacterium]|nr:CAP domain-containing protein [Lachnospiraceae bacterium]
MKRPMMLGMAALALTVTVVPLQAQASQGSCIQSGNLQMGNCTQLQDCIQPQGDTQLGNSGNVLVYGSDGNVKDTLQNILNGNCENLGNLLNGNACQGTDCDITGGNGNCDNDQNGDENDDSIQKPEQGEKPDDSTGGSTEDSTEDNTDLSYARQVVNLVNVERSKEGLSPLTLDTKVTTAANVRATEIQTSFSHTRPNGSSFSTVLGENGVSYRGSGENIAYGQRSPEEVVTGWMNSAGHRANIMNQNFKNIGVGHAQNSNGTQYWVQLFTY